MAESFEGKTMKAARLVEFNKPYRIETVPVPKIGPNDLLLRIGAAGFCHTDVIVTSGAIPLKLPVTASHEPVGTIVAVGEKAATSGKWKVGQRAGMLNFKHACGECVNCKLCNSDPRFCERKDVVESAGITHDGGFAEYAVADAATSVQLPANLPFEQCAPLMCAGATVYAGLKSATATLPPNSPIGIIGIGGLGQLGIQLGKALGHRVAALDNRPEGRALAGEVALPADKIVDASDAEAAAKECARWAGGGGLAAVVCCTDSVEAQTLALKVVRVRGVVVLIGFPVDGFRFDPWDVIFKELVLKGSLLASVEQAREMVDLVAEHGIRSHVTTVSFDDIPKLPELYGSKELKGRLVMKIES